MLARYSNFILDLLIPGCVSGECGSRAASRLSENCREVEDQGAG